MADLSFVRFEKEHGTITNPERSPPPADQGAVLLGGQTPHNGPQRPPLAHDTPGKQDVSRSALDSPDAGTNGGGNRSREQPSTTSPDLEMSRPASPRNHDTAAVIHTWRQPSINKWRIMSACLAEFGQGFNDSAPGALLPYMEQHYNIDYATVATIFVGNAIGFIIAAFFVHALDHRLGRAKTFVFCEVLNVIAFAIMIIPPPFPLFAIGYFVTGYSLATALSLNNVFCANTEPATIVLGAFHSSYGTGGTIAPLIATAMVTSGIVFSRFYSLLLGIRILSGICLWFTFRHWDSHNTGLNAADNDISLQDLNAPSSQQETSNEPTQRTHEPRRKSSTLWPALKNKTTLIGAVFIFAYQGAEVSISGWVVSFLITVRHGEPSRVGNVTAGFWGGITLGRLAFPPLAQRIGEKTLTYGLIIGAVAFEIAVWRLESVIGDSVFIALLGLLLGPIYPCATVVFTRLLPRNLQNTAIAFISSAGSSGGAVAPFLTGLLAQAAGTWVLHPITIGLCALMMGCWLALPRIPKRSD